MHVDVVHALRDVADPGLLVLHGRRDQVDEVAGAALRVQEDFEVAVARAVEVLVDAQAAAAVRALRQHLRIACESSHSKRTSMHCARLSYRRPRGRSRSGPR